MNFIQNIYWKYIFLIYTKIILKFNLETDIKRIYISFNSCRIQYEMYFNEVLKYSKTIIFNEFNDDDNINIFILLFNHKL